MMDFLLEKNRLAVLHKFKFFYLFLLLYYLPKINRRIDLEMLLTKQSFNSGITKLIENENKLHLSEKKINLKIFFF
jgi:hypothetical protein